MNKLLASNLMFPISVHQDWKSAIQRLEFKVTELQACAPTLSLRQPSKV